MNQILTVLFFVVILSACTGTYSTKINDSFAHTLRGKSLVVTSSNTPRFNVVTRIVFNGDPISNGNKLIKDYNLSDPSVAIASQVSNRLANTFSMKRLRPVRIEEYDTIEYLASKYKNNDFVLDIRTSNWTLGFNPFKQGALRLIYRATLYLIDTKTEEVVTESLCAIKTSESKAYTYDQYMASNAMLLKQELQSITQHCINEFEKQFN